MPTIGWVSIGVAIGGALLGLIMYLVRRRDARIDALALAVFGDAVTPGLHKYVTHSVMNEKISELKSNLQGIAEEGVRREERILSAIENQTLVIGSEVSEIKTDQRAQNKHLDEVVGEIKKDIREQNKRIDDVMRQASSNQR